MSLITRCPACETMFKVVPDQLRISEGWVRCGQCSEIFNASQHLVGPPGPQAEAGHAPSTVAQPATVPQPAPAPFVPAAIDNAAPAATPEVPPLPPDTGWDAAARQPAHEAATGTPPFVAQEPRWDDPPTFAEPEPFRAAAPPSSSVQAGTPESPSVADTWPQQTSSAPEPDVSFLHAGASANTFWQRRSVRILLALLAIALVAALAAQFLVHERNRIAQIEPATRPVLAALCALAHCELGPLKQIESIVIDSSSFGRLRAENYRLGFSLRNTAPIDVAMPSIELSLTDTQDQALVRRVIRPDEFGAPTPALAAGSDWSGTLTLNVKLSSTTEHIAGYRLLAFYP